MTPKSDEAAFEAHICDSLVAHGGYTAVKLGTDFDAERGLDTVELFAFLEATQPEAWDRLTTLHGGSLEAGRERFLDRLCKEIDTRGTVDVLRRGVVDLGVTMRVAFWKPAHGLTPELLERYARNRLTVTRQLPYEKDSEKTVDLCLFVNGLPVATAELKNPLTGQTIAHAKAQYRQHRDPNNLTLSRRAVVHFAVDTEEVAMTTRLSGNTTRFLPFNRGHDKGKGNPPNPGGHRIAYLWQEVWRRDPWLDILRRFVHVEKPAKGSKAEAKVIFPRFHQWDAVLDLEAGAREEGPGHSYLVEHSAGSGKSNTIAWLAHRLASLHGDDDEAVFDKVVVITDRRVLDRQLQETIYQFDHVHGVVVRIDQDSKQLAATLESEQARIIITTLQKFPFVLDQTVSVPARKYAVIVDEAHSSQTGDTAKDMKLVLSGETEADVVKDASEEEPSEPEDPVEAVLLREVAARGRQPNLSFFAFTATPKGRTLELFGHRNPETGVHEPFHLYSMKQAIEEGFILEVLSHYVTYQTYWKIEKAIREDPKYESAKAKSAIAKAVSLHEVNLAQKAEIIIEHFRQHVAHRIGGRAKAMVVTSSRKHAMRYKLALDKYIESRGYDDVATLVAFSGTVFDDGLSWTEPSMNAFPESETAERFGTDDYKILVVAEKFQTGFDQPLLYAMYVDKVLTGLGAVQTLSRLNRICDGKEGTFVLDFRNEAEAIRESFEPWYGETVAPATDPNLLYDTRHALDEFGVLWEEEAKKIVLLLKSGDPAKNHGRIHAALQPAVDRFQALSEEEQDAFRDSLNRFVRIYAFLSQVVAFTDTALERDYLFCRALASLIRQEPGGALDLGRDVELTHLRIQKTSEGSISLDADTGVVQTVFSGTGKQSDSTEEPLSVIIEKLNERFGLKLGEADKLHLDAIAADLIADESLQQQAAANTAENFGLVFQEAFQDAVIGRMSAAEQLTYSILDNDDLKAQVMAAYLPLVYGRAKVAHQEHCPIGELLERGEDAHLEFKSSLRTEAETGKVAKHLEAASLKTVAAFLNSREGGTLLIGVRNDGTSHGLAADFATLAKPGKDDKDRFGQHLDQLLVNSVGEAASANVTLQFHSVNGDSICRVHVKPSAHPVEATVRVLDKGGQLQKKTAFYIRLNQGTREVTSEAETQKYIAQRWKA